MRGIVFDAGALIAFERRDRRLSVIHQRALDGQAEIVVPAPVVAQVLRDPSRQVRLWRMIQSKSTEIRAFDEDDAKAVGALLGKSRTTDVVDAHVVFCAQRNGYAIVTSDPSDLLRLDGRLTLLRV